MNLFLVFALQSKDDIVRPEDDIVGKWVLLFAAVILVLLLVIYTYRRLRRHFAVRKQWMKTEATIESGFGAETNVPDPYLGPHYFWQPALQYTYQVGRESYSGCFLLDRIINSPEHAKGATREWLNLKIVVRYNPANPQESVFLEQDGAPPGSRSMSVDAPLSDLVTLSLK